MKKFEKIGLDLDQSNAISQTFTEHLLCTLPCQSKVKTVLQLQGDLSIEGITKSFILLFSYRFILKEKLLGLKTSTMNSQSPGCIIMTAFMLDCGGNEKRELIPLSGIVRDCHWSSSSIYNHISKEHHSFLPVMIRSVFQLKFRMNQGLTPFSLKVYLHFYSFYQYICLM